VDEMTDDEKAKGFWDVEDLTAITDPQNTANVTLTLTEDVTVKMPIGVQPVGDTVITVTLTVTYDRTNGQLSAAIKPTNSELVFQNEYVTTEAAVLKVWDDQNNQDGKRPTSLDVYLSWTYRGKTETVDTLKAAMEAEFEAIGKTAEMQAFLDSLKFEDHYTLNKDNHWSWMVTGLPTIWNGDPITYSWTEKDPGSGYTLTNTGTTGKLTTFTNKYVPEETEVHAVKVWEDRNNAKNKRPTSIKVQLYADGKAYDKPVTLSEGSWKADWTGLPKYTNESGETGKATEIQYTVAELEVPAEYVVTIEGNTTLYTITNTLPEGGARIEKSFLSDPEEPIFVPDIIDIPVTKIWIDNDNAAGMRPNAITVHLFAGGTEVEARTLSAANGWTYTFTDLPAYNEDRLPIAYSVTEDAVPNYTTEVNGFIITNTYQEELMSVAVQKVWDDNNDALGLRPASITMTLNNGMRVVLNAANNWTAVITGLPAIVNGQPAVYTWTEQEVAGYVQAGAVTAGSVTVFTNTIFETPPRENDTPPRPGTPTYVFEDYETPLGIEVEINHVGDCFD